LVVAFTLLACHPFTTYPVSLLLARAVRGVKAPSMRLDTANLSVAVLCCAYNEETVIRAKLENSLRLRALEPSTRILFYTDGCTDRTAALIAEQADDIHLIASDKRHGKKSRHDLLAAAAGDVDVLLFTDANVRRRRGGDRRGAPRFADPEIGCVCGHLVYVNAGTARPPTPARATGRSTSG